MADRSSARVSVVIPAFNAEGVLGEQLEALAGQDYQGDWEVLVADNGSTDGTAELVRRWGERIGGLRLVDASDVRGATHARNVGSAAATGDLLVYCDADDVVAPGWLSELVRVADGADVVAGALEHQSLNDPTILAWRYLVNDVDAVTAEASGVPVGPGGLAPDPGRPLRFLPFAVSANCAVRREVWRQLGGWDTRYPHGGDDVDFSWRAQLAGFRFAFAPRAVVHYRHRDSLRGAAKQAFDYAFADVQLYATYRAQGAKRQPAREVARSYLYPITRLPFLLMSKRHRGFWVVAAASDWGRIRGCLRHRIFFP